MSGLSFQQIAIGKDQKEQDNAEKINNIPAVDHTPANAAVMEVDAQHFDVIIGARLKGGNAADGVEPAVQHKAQKCAGNKGYYRVIGNAAAGNADGHKYAGQKNKPDV